MLLLGHALASLLDDGSHSAVLVFSHGGAGPKLGYLS